MPPCAEVRSRDWPSPLTARHIAALRSVDRRPVPLRVPVQQNTLSDRDAMSLQVPSKRPTGAPRLSSTPRTAAHLNGDPLSVFDDSTLSDLSDSEGRYIHPCVSWLPGRPLLLPPLSTSLYFPTVSQHVGTPFGNQGGGEITRELIHSSSSVLSSSRISLHGQAF